MAMENKSFKQELPEGKLRLSNEEVIDCYPLEQPQATEKIMATPSQNADYEKDELKMFLDNAFLFFSHRERILSDSRMFLCRIPVSYVIKDSNEVIYSYPTLGQYLEWWYRCGNSCFALCSQRAFIYDFASSPIDKEQYCYMVNDKGEVIKTEVCYFDKMWSSFIHSFGLYEEAKYKYQSYSLCEVLEIFQQEGRTDVDGRFIETYFMMQDFKVVNYNHWLERDSWEKKEKRYLECLFTLGHKEIKKMYAVYKNVERLQVRKLQEIQKQRRELQKKLKEGKMERGKYLEQLKLLRIEKEKVKEYLNDCQYNFTDSLFPDLDVCMEDVEDYLKNNLFES